MVFFYFFKNDTGIGYFDIFSEYLLFKVLVFYELTFLVFFANILKYFRTLKFKLNIWGFGMPLPLGHAVIGAAVYSVCANIRNNVKKNNYFIFGLMYAGDGSIMHRGPTHSIYFALLFGYLAHLFSKYSIIIPEVGFIPCLLVILSHPILDIVTDILERECFSWKYFLQLYYFPLTKPGYNIGFWDIINTIFEKSLGDYKIIVFGFFVIFIVIIIKKIC